ncbi:DNA recombination protein RmuC [Limnobacter humi]|uniref:DNA recombination protein RmuC n=1 Tax=Limnobacter humi TaxID=1778671 RepID=A0ABT1WEE8_9BURK|nr:DNA recombination protein RmuC [Limnobacter humi]MCQ8895893.1 DNA recombination protein RmuC [Limnobacter humi]
MSNGNMDWLLPVLLVLSLIQLVGLWVLWRRSQGAVADAVQLPLQTLQADLSEARHALAQQRFQADEMAKQLHQMGLDLEARLNRQAEGMQVNLAQQRGETQQLLQGLQTVVGNQFSQGSQLQAERLNQFAEILHRTNALINDQLNQIRLSLEQKLKDIQQDNAGKLEEMRRTVDEKLHATLEQRLGESFKQVSDRLEQVYKGLGEMQSLATGVGDLKRVLTNVKTRGTWGEVQLQALLEQMLTPAQFGQNIKPVPGSSNIVEFAVRLPGKEDDKPVWLPIDSKFPKEQYERLLEAFDRADADGVATASKALEQAVRLEAKSIAEKYLAPPYTTDFGILFLPTEGLYAEVVKRPGLVDELQRVHRVTVAGPITLTTLLNALQLGFKTLALEKRSSEVWTILSAVKTEFGKFGDVLAKTKDTLERAARNIEGAEQRSRVMQRKLKGLDMLPEQEAIQILGVGHGDDGSAGAEPDDDEGLAP